MHLPTSVVAGSDITTTVGKCFIIRFFRSPLHGLARLDWTRPPACALMILAMQSLLLHTRLSLLVFMALSVGLHWNVLQMIGWVSMTVEYSQTVPLSDALAMTFDGRHPCKLCKLVAEKGPTSEQTRGSVPLKKIEVSAQLVALWSDEIDLSQRSVLSCSWPTLDLRALSSRDRPVLPPPRRLAS